ncbi:MAG: cell division protein ZapA [Novosphingobium sp.]
MSNIALQVGGRSYTVNCAAGEEDHIAELGEMIDAKLTSMGAAGQNETRSLLFAALLLADEVYEFRSSGSASAPAERPAAPSAHADPDPAAYAPAAYATPDPVVFPIDPEQLEAIAMRLENLASHLEG